MFIKQDYAEYMVKDMARAHFNTKGEDYREKRKPF